MSNASELTRRPARSSLRLVPRLRVGSDSSHCVEKELPPRTVVAAPSDHQPGIRYLAQNPRQGLEQLIMPLVPLRRIQAATAQHGAVISVFNLKHLLSLTPW